MPLRQSLSFLFLLLQLLLAKPADSKCQKSFHCGHLGTLQFPLYHNSTPGCGLFAVDGCDSETPTIQFRAGGPSFDILENISTNEFFIRSPVFRQQLSVNTGGCFPFKDLSLPHSPFSSSIITPNLTTFLCNESDRFAEEYFKSYNRTDACPSFVIYYNCSDVGVPPPSVVPLGCVMTQLPRIHPNGSCELRSLLTSEFALEWNVSRACYDCHHSGGQCLTGNTNEFVCQKGIILLKAEE